MFLGQTVTLTRPSVDPAQSSQRLAANPLPPTSSIAPAAVPGTTPPSPYPVQTNRTSPATNKSLSPIASKPPGLAVAAAAPKTQSPAQNAAVLPQENSQDKLAEQVKLVRYFLCHAFTPFLFLSINLMKWEHLLFFYDSATSGAFCRFTVILCTSFQGKSNPSADSRTEKGRFMVPQATA